MNAALQAVALWSTLKSSNNILIFIALAYSNSQVKPVENQSVFKIV